ncbi:MAG: hypothetical protein KF901_02115 [Myxococcales bacterium]|nr:hypothetical protein [Myxococcales bacterium]
MNEAEDLRQLLPPLDEAPGPARKLDDAEAAALVTSVLDAWAPAPPPAGPEPTTGLSGLTSTKLAAIGLGSVALVALGVGAVLLWPRAPEAPAQASAPADTTRPTDDEASALAVMAPTGEERLDFAEPAPLILSDDDELDDAADGTLDPVTPRTRRARRARTGPSPAPPTMEADSADDLLRRANALRSQRRWAEAERAYVEVTSAHSSTHAAYVARVAAAALRLEHLGDPAGAARLYRAAIAHGGGLDAEARHGLARAYARLGRRAEEADTLRGLLHRHPSSPFASAARSRLAALEVE